MVIPKVLAAALAQKAARSQGATAAEASRAAALATVFPNPVAGLVIARAMRRPRGKPTKEENQPDSEAGRGSITKRGNS